MTPAQLHDALAQGLTQTDIDDQDAEDEAFDRMAQQASSPAPAQPHFLRCLGHRTEYMLAVPCQHCKRLTLSVIKTIDGADECECDLLETLCDKIKAVIAPQVVEGGSLC